MDSFNEFKTARKKHKHKLREYIDSCDEPSQAFGKYTKIFDLNVHLENNKKPLDLAGKTYLAPLTTVTNCIEKIHNVHHLD